MVIPFYKCNGNNNKFIILLKSEIPKNFTLNKKIIKKICTNFDKEIVDGLILFDDINKYKIDYYNNDGTWETFCLNGLRCCAQIAYKIYNEKEFTIISNKKEYNCTIVDNNNIQVNLHLPQYKLKNISIEGYLGNFIDSGAKHFVIECNNDNWPNYKNAYVISKKIRYNKKIFPNGTNVNFYRKIMKNTIEVLTYEKGIENLMQSCASGSLACMYDYYKKHTINGKIIIKNMGGNLLGEYLKKLNQISIKGEAMIEYHSKGEY